MLRGGTAVPCLLDHQVAGLLNVNLKKLFLKNKEREGRKIPMPYPPNFAYNGQKSVTLFAQGVAVSIHCN